MKHIIAIRTNKWTEEEKRLLASLRPYWGDNVVVVFHNRPEGLELPLEVVDVSDEWVSKHDLRNTGDWGWRCGDYFYYALRAAKPDFDYYWLVEPDVLLGGDVGAFFNLFDDEKTDALGYNLYEFKQPKHRFARGMSDIPLWVAIFPLTRFSGRALDMLIEKRKINSTRRIRNRLFANDELFSFSTVMDEKGMSARRINDVAPDWFEGVQFATDPDQLIDTLPSGPDAPNKIYHPVRGHESFKRGVAARLGIPPGYLKRMRASLKYMSDEDLVEIADKAGVAILAALRAAKAKK